MSARFALLGLVVAVAACGGTPAPASPAAPATPAALPKVVQLNQPGEVVDVIGAIPAGYVTVVDFWSKSCKPCEVYGGLLEAGIAHDPRIVVRKVDVGDGFTPVAEVHAITALPHFKIYDRQKQLRYELVGEDCAEASAIARQLADE